jgi:hypothetical protein
MKKSFEWKRKKRVAWAWQAIVRYLVGKIEKGSIIEK